MVSRHMTELFGEIVGIIAAGLPGVQMTTEQVPDGPKLSTFCLPYFFDEDDALSTAPNEVPNE